MPHDPSAPEPAALARHIVSLLPQSVCLVDMSGTVVATSEAMADRLGLRPDEVAGRPVGDFVEDDPAEVERVLRMWRGSSGWRPGPLHVRGTDPGGPGLRCRGARLPGTELLLVEVDEHARAIAEFVALSREVELSNLRRMETRLQESLAELESANRRLETANEELERYASMVAHDIRTPFNAIGRFTELLVADHADELPDDAGEMLGAIGRLAERGEEVAVALLSLARTGEAEPVPGGTDSNAVATYVLRDLEDAVDEAAAELSIGDLPWTTAQPVHLERVLTNLIANSLRYAAEDRSPVIVVEGERDAGMVRFTVSDNGVGIGDEERERIFEPLVRGAAGIARPGTGVGLTTCRKIVQAYGGTIGVVESRGSGATLQFTLPAADRPEARPTA